MATPKKWQHPEGTPMTCWEEGCGSPVAVAGVCGPHYYRSRKTGTGKRAVRTAGVSSCSQLGCARLVTARNLCDRHYRRALSTRPPVAGDPRRKWYNPDGSRMTCSETDCLTPVQSKGLCTLHYDRAWKRANGLSKRPESVCAVPRCERVKALRGAVCGNCKQKMWRYGLDLPRYLALINTPVCSNAGCGETENLHIDHDHQCCPPGRFESTKVACGGCVRGWLCRACNLSLGAMQEDPQRIRGLLDYLLSFRP